MTRKKEVLERLCELTAEVMRRKFNYEKAADCFCGKTPQHDFRFDREVLEFIAEAIREKLEREAVKP
jgi:hypothetical protein